LRKRTIPWLIIAAITTVGASPNLSLAMHIADGIRPASWAGLWFLVALPFLAWGLHDLKKRSQQALQFKPLVALVGAAVFVISCLPIPVPLTGTCSHMCGTGLAAILIGPTITVVIASVGLVLQALFLAHGGLTTLGANIVSMGVVGAFAGYGVFRLALVVRLPLFAAALLAGILSDWATYATTSFELATGLTGPGAPKMLFTAILLAFVPTQLPLGLLEGLISAMACRFIRLRRPELLTLLRKGAGE